MLGERIKALRLSFGINQIEFGRRLNVTKQSVSNWENGNIQPSVDMLRTISETYSVSTDYLLGLSERKHVEVDGLTAEQIAHIQLLVDDLRKVNRNEKTE